MQLDTDGGLLYYQQRWWSCMNSKLSIGPLVLVSNKPLINTGC